MSRCAKNRQLTPRDALRLRLACDILSGMRLTTPYLIEHYYQALSPASFHKTFKRDREALASEGIFLVEERNGTAKTWTLDRHRSLAKTAALDDEDTRAVANLMAALATQLPGTELTSLGGAAARIGRSLGIPLDHPAKSDCAPEVLEQLSWAFAHRRPCELSYRAATDNSPRARILCTYGLFELGGARYAVGLRSREGTPDAIRTLRLSHIHAAQALADEPAYEIPKGFDVNDYRLLPFEFGNEPAYDAAFYVPRAAVANFRERARKRGEATCHQGGSVEWHIQVHDIKAAAAWAAELGILPLSPTPLVSAWENLLEEAAR